MIENPNDVILDSQDWRDTKQGLSYKEIVMAQVRLCVKNFSQEMRKGFWIYHYASSNHVGERIRYIGDSRRELLGSIESLNDILLPKFDEQMRKASEELENQIVKHKKVSQIKTDVDLDNYWEEKLGLYRNLFRELVKFLERMSWLDMQSTEE